MKVSLIITTFNRFDALELVLNSIEFQTILPHEIIIADDGSNINTVKKLDNFIKSSELNIIHSWQENLGFRLARSRNKAINISSGEYIIVVDGDMILDPNFISDHISHARRHQYIQGSRVLLTESKTSQVINNKDIFINFYSRGILNRKNAIRSKLLSKIFSKKSNSMTGIRGCNMGFFKTDCEKINGFNNKFEGWGREDSEFVVRFLNAGFIKKHLKFSAVQYHLWHGHESEKSLPENDEILAEAINNNLSWCDSGLNEFQF